MSLSIENQIHNFIKKRKRGKIFFAINFINFGTSTAVRKALDRLENKSVLIRLSHGIYLYPKKHKVLGNLLPSIEEIATAISKRDKTRIIPTGVQAMNKLGLSTQVPMNLVYLTDGSPRTIHINNQSIKFKKASPKILSVKSKIILLIIQALKEIGKDNLDGKTTQKIKQILTQIDVKLIKHDMQLAPSWITELMKDSIK